jgi:hypothetical protein
MPDFKFVADETALRERIEKLRKQYEERAFVRYEDGEDFSDFKGYLTEPQYQANLDEFSKELDKMLTPEFQHWAIDNAPRKKNGTFYKGRVVKRVGNDNCIFIQEWHNTWIYECLTVKAIDDLTLELTIQALTDTPG